MTTTHQPTTPRRHRRRNQSPSKIARREAYLKEKLGAAYVPRDERRAAKAAEAAAGERPERVTDERPEHPAPVADTVALANVREQALAVACYPHAVPAGEACHVVPTLVAFRDSSTSICADRLRAAGVQLAPLAPRADEATASNEADDADEATESNDSDEITPAPRPRRRAPLDGTRRITQPRRARGRSDPQEREHRRARNKAA